MTAIEQQIVAAIVMAIVKELRGDGRPAPRLKTTRMQQRNPTPETDDALVRELVENELALRARIAEVEAERAIYRQMATLALTELEWFRHAFEAGEDGHRAINRRLAASRQRQRELGKDIAVERPAEGVAA